MEEAELIETWYCPDIQLVSCLRENTNEAPYISTIGICSHIPATLEPSQVVQNISAPDVCGFCFFGDVMEDINQEGRLRKAEGCLTV